MNIPNDITKYLTTVNYKKGTNKKNNYIVIHYTAGNGDTAISNANYFHSTYRDASANYFVDENSIVQVVEDYDIAWHCGSETGLYYHKYCRNSCSIGIEMCSVIKDGKYEMPENTIYNTV